MRACMMPNQCHVVCCMLLLLCQSAQALSAAANSTQLNLSRDGHAVQPQSLHVAVMCKIVRQAPELAPFDTCQLMHARSDNWVHMHVTSISNHDTTAGCTVFQNLLS